MTLEEAAEAADKRGRRVFVVRFATGQFGLTTVRAVREKPIIARGLSVTRTELEMLKGDIEEALNG